MNTPYVPNPTLSTPPHQVVGGHNPIQLMNPLPQPSVQIIGHKHGASCNSGCRGVPSMSCNPYGTPQKNNL
jgi:hypothetical protein